MNGERFVYIKIGQETKNRNSPEHHPHPYPSPTAPGCFATHTQGAGPFIEVGVAVLETFLPFNAVSHMLPNRHSA